MPSRSNVEIKSRLALIYLALGAVILTLVLVLLLQMLLPVLMIAIIMVGLGLTAYWLWSQWQQQRRQQQRQQAQLDAKFYQLLRQQQGRISVLDFAMYAQINGIAAQQYLNSQAQAFCAYCETPLPGEVIYVFNLAAVHSSPRHHAVAQAEAAWAYAEQARFEQARAEKAHAAWANAKQIRTLQQLSQRRLEVSAESTETEEPDVLRIGPAKTNGAQIANGAQNKRLKSNEIMKQCELKQAELKSNSKSGYIAILEINSHHSAKDDQQSSDQPTVKTHRSIELPHRSSHHSSMARLSIAAQRRDGVVTIDVPATPG
ncbi:MAG: hypothetical protein WBD47_19320 [Phormidesmis sp.]